MPLYEYECPIHGVFEELHRMNDRPEESNCPVYEQDSWGKCGKLSPIQISAPTMKPDKHWAGTITASGKYVTSEKDFREENKYMVPADRANMEYVQKKHTEVGLERYQRKNQKVEKFLANQLAGVAIDGDHYTVAQENRAKRMRRSE